MLWRWNYIYIYIYLLLSLSLCLCLLPSFCSALPLSLCLALCLSFSAWNETGGRPEQVKETVADCRKATGSDKVLLVGHSAGGWLARAALGAGEWEDGVSSEDVVTGEGENKYCHAEHVHN